MNKLELEDYLIKYLLDELNIDVNFSSVDKTQFLRGLLNKRDAKEASNEFIEKQDAYLKLLLEEKGIIDYKSFTKINNIYLIQSDITRINTDCIVNAANSAMLGCFYPNHHCIDNAIHTFSGVQLRLECNKLMNGKHQDTSIPLMTDSYNLPCNKIIHVVGPIVYSTLTDLHISQLRDCYRNILKLAKENNMESIAICCISTGEFSFPNDIAANIAISEVNKFLESNTMDIIFNVFKDVDYELYEKILRS